MNAVEPYLPYLLPPLLGAIIGYVTNYIAIRMLFRPLTEKRVFGMRVPFTPGIIPRRRVALAESIGRMVSTQLITEETVRTHLEAEDFYSRATVAVGKATEGLIDTPIDAHVIKGTVKDILDPVEANTRSGPHRVVVAFVDAVVETLGAVRLKRFLPTGQRRSAAIEGAYAALVEGPLRESLKDAAGRWVEAELQSGTTLESFFPDESINAILDVANRLYDTTLDALIRWLRQPGIRREMERRGRGIVRDIVERLTIFQRLLVSAAQYDRRVDESMPQIVTDIIASLEQAGADMENRAMVLAGLRAFLYRLRETPMESAAGGAGIDPARAMSWVVDKLVDLLESATAREAVVTSVARRIENLEEHSLLEIARMLTKLDEEATRTEIRTRILSAIEGRKGNVPRVVETLLDGIHGVTLRDLISLDTPTKERIDGKIAAGLIRMTASHLPSIVAALDIYGLVVNRINALDVADVETLLLMVISKHLKWINLFGALLGALIGGTQVVAARFW